MDLEKVVLQGLSLQKLLPREGLEAASLERVLSRLSRNCLHLPLSEAQSAESHLSQQGLQQQRRAWELLSCFCFLRLANPARNRRERAHLPPPGPQRLVWELCCARSPATASPERSSVRTVSLGTACRPPESARSRTGSQHGQVFSVVVLTYFDFHLTFLEQNYMDSPERASGNAEWHSHSGGQTGVKVTS